MTVRPPTLAELADWLWRLPEGADRRFLEERYWAVVAEEHGKERAENWRWEYEWLRRHR